MCRARPDRRCTSVFGDAFEIVVAERHERVRDDSAPAAPTGLSSAWPSAMRLKYSNARRSSLIDAVAVGIHAAELPLRRHHALFGGVLERHQGLLSIRLERAGAGAQRLNGAIGAAGAAKAVGGGSGVRRHGAESTGARGAARGVRDRGQRDGAGAPRRARRARNQARRTRHIGLHGAADRRSGGRATAWPTAGSCPRTRMRR